MARKNQFLMKSIMKIVLFCSVLLAGPVLNLISAAPCDCSDLKHIRPSEKSCLLNQLLHVVSHLISCGDRKLAPEDYKTLIEATKCDKSKQEPEELLPSTKILPSEPLFPITLPPDYTSETDVSSDSTSEASTEETTDIDITVTVSTEKQETSEDTSSTEEEVTTEITKPNETSKSITIDITTTTNADSTNESNETTESATTPQKNDSSTKKRIEVDITTVANVDKPQPDIENRKINNRKHKPKCQCGCFPSDAQVFFIPVLSFHNSPGLTPHELGNFLFNKLSLPN